MNHEKCKDGQCHVRDHCDRCGQIWPCDASVMVAALAVRQRLSDPNAAKRQVRA